MINPSNEWRIRSDVAWVGDEVRVIAAHTSPPDADGPRILEGATSWVWLRLSAQEVVALGDGVAEQALINLALKALADAKLIVPA
ncbi:hypothetical protein J2X11_001014 [Aeromicrobium panaciterrae]|uniref:Uncharacterized protein n=1 Tax=Aeromicrobium panaciterrae TaxID=363861 RepID=A0ABU1ULX9_9ACTN|nr:hypothetical protein [Aeromicrobium panaciterrae]MDR7086175.1 hypothetical protein [Aeromicrobium panaciterrae]